MREALQATKGIGSVCVTDTGAPSGRLLGIVTPQDYDLVSDGHTRLGDIMTRQGYSMLPRLSIHRVLTTGSMCPHECSKLNETSSEVSWT